MAKLIPAEVSLETLNSQYLQRHATEGKSVLAVARVLRRLEAPPAEVESVLFSLVQDEVKVDIPVRLVSVHLVSFLINSIYLRRLGVASYRPPFLPMLFSPR